MKRIALIILFILPLVSFAQRNAEINLPHYDNRKIHYGFLMGIHRTYWDITYSERFTYPSYDSLHSILSPPRLGFALGFIVNLRVGEFFDLRATPKVSFYEYMVEYNFKDGSQINQLVESTVVELPILFKYKSIRWTNSRIYIIGGFVPGFQASGNKDDEKERKLQTGDFNLSGDLGFGFDYYFPLFKFSPEIRFSRGLVNMIQEDRYGYSDGIERLTTNTFTFYLLFE